MPQTLSEDIATHILITMENNDNNTETLEMILSAGRLLNGVRLAALAAKRSGAADADSLGLCGGRDKQDVKREALNTISGWDIDGKY